MLSLTAIHAGTTIHNKQKNLKIPAIHWRKLFIIGDTTQQVQRRYQIHCDTQCSANTEDYMQLQWHRTTSHYMQLQWHTNNSMQLQWHTSTSHYMQLQWHTNTSHTTETMTTQRQRHITQHMLWYANTEDYMHLQWHTNSSYTTETMTHIKMYNTAHAMICQATNTMFDYNALIKKHIVCVENKNICPHFYCPMIPLSDIHAGTTTL